MNELLENLLMEEWQNQTQLRSKERPRVIQINKIAGQRICELGGGANPAVHPKCMGGEDLNVDVRMCHNAEGKQTTDFTANFDEPLPIASDEWDAVVCIFCLEHVSYPKVPQFLSEMCRIVKPGGRCIVVIPNSEAQLKWIQANPDGWDGKPAFISISEILFGSQDYEANAHKSYFSPSIAFDLFRAAGFENILISPYGVRDTDMSIQATKPAVTSSVPAVGEVKEMVKEGMVSMSAVNAVTTLSGQSPASVVVRGLAPAPSEPVQPKMSAVDRASMFDWQYFKKGKNGGGYSHPGLIDFPCHNATLSHILARRPASTLEIGGAYGHVTKRLQDAGVRAQMLEISEHCFLNRVCDGFVRRDASEIEWPLGKKEFDLGFSVAVLEHVPEDLLPDVLRETARVCKRSLHGIGFDRGMGNSDVTKLTWRTESWWQGLFRKLSLGDDHQFCDKDQLEAGALSPDILAGDGKVKVNVCADRGNALPVFSYHGWLNVSGADLGQFAASQNYRFERKNVVEGLSCQTQTCDLLFSDDLLPTFESYDLAVSHLRDCRRAIKSDGLMRICVTDATVLTKAYVEDKLGQWEQMNEAVAKSSGPGRLQALAFGDGRKTLWDADKVQHALQESGWVGHRAEFRKAADMIDMTKGWTEQCEQILRETTESHRGGTVMFWDCVPLTGK